MFRRLWPTPRCGTRQHWLASNTGWRVTRTAHSRRAFNDPRNQLVGEFVRLVDELKASYFVFENAKGLTVGRQRAFLEEIVEEFAKRKYNVVLPWAVLNAGDFGVPQNRERLILLGAKRGLTLPQYSSAGAWGPLSNFRMSTCSDALDDLPDVDDFQELVESDSVKLESWDVSSSYARELHCLANDSWHYGYPRKWDPKILTSSMRTEHSKITCRRFGETLGGDA